jgi:hypothetical protein
MNNDAIARKIEEKPPSTLILSDPPTAIRQDDFSPARGNALQACVASLFGQALNDVPNFIALECGYQQGIEHHVQESKLNVIKKMCNEISKEDEGKLCILRGKSPRGDFGHVVIARIVKGSFEMVHDPHPDDTYLDPEEAYGWYMLFY